MVRKILLVCGIVAALLYVGSDIIAALRWEGYSYTAQSVSELRAIDAPTRAFLMPILFLYGLCEFAFGIGIWRTGAHKLSLRITGILLVALGVVDLSAYFFPLHLSEEVNAFANTMHLILTAVTVLLILSIVGFGALAEGKWFRIYSYATIVLILVTGFLSFGDVPRIAAHLPTPWLGVRERINIYSYMLWLAMLAVVCLRRAMSEKPQGDSPPQEQGRGQFPPTQRSAPLRHGR